MTVGKEINIHVEKSEIENHLKMLFDYWSYPNHDKVVEYYSSGMEYKNDKIKEMFDGTDGRIEIDLDQYLVVPPKERFKDMSNYFETRFIPDALKEFDLSCSNAILDKIKVAFIDFIFCTSIDSNGKIVDEDGLGATYKGMKFTKAFNLYSDFMISSFRANEFSSWTDDGGFQDKIDVKRKFTNWMKNNVIGGTLASIFSSSNNSLYEGRSLILSIRPEDFFTMSVGNNWTSCMAPDGEYSSGVFGYITGKDTVIAYLKETKKIDDFMSNKIWRQITYIPNDQNLDLVISQKGYPDQRATLVESISSFILDKLNFKGDKSNHKSKIDFELENSGVTPTYGYVDCFQYGNEAIAGIYGEIDKIKDFARYDNEGTKKIIIAPQGFGMCFGCNTVYSSLSDTQGYCFSCEECERAECEHCGSYINEDEWIEYEVISNNNGLRYTLCACDYCIEDVAEYVSQENAFISYDSLVDDYNGNPIVKYYAVELSDIGDNEGQLAHEDYCFYLEEMDKYFSTKQEADLYLESLSLDDQDI